MKTLPRPVLLLCLLFIASTLSFCGAGHYSDNAAQGNTVASKALNGLVDLMSSSQIANAQKEASVLWERIKNRKSP